MKSMKVAVCVDKLKMGGSTFSAALIASGLANQGHNINLVVTRPLPGRLPDSLTSSNLHILTPCKGIFPFRKRLKQISDFLSDYDVILNNHSVVTRLVTPSLPERIIRISTIRSVAPSSIVENAVNYSKYFDALVGISPSVCDALNDSGAKTEIRLIANAVPVLTNRQPQLTDRCRLLFIGRMENKAKNITILPWIMAVLKARGINVFLNIIGDGPDSELLQEEIKRSGCSDRIAVHGACSRSETFNYLCQSNFILVPSYYEGFGLVVAEGMAAGCVPVTSNIKVFQWLLGRWASTLQCPIDRPDVYANKIIHFLENRDLYKKVQRELRERQIAEFSPEKTVEGYTNLIEDKRSDNSRHIRRIKNIGQTLPINLRIRYSLLYSIMSRVMNKGRYSN